MKQVNTEGQLKPDEAVDNVHENGYLPDVPAITGPSFVAAVSLDQNVSILRQDMQVDEPGLFNTAMQILPPFSFKVFQRH